MESLYRDAWIDHRTRAVFIEFTVYNPNVNLFTSINLMAEFPPVGAAMHFTSIMTFRLYHYVGTYGTLVVVAQVSLQSSIYNRGCQTRRGCESVFS